MKFNYKYLFLIILIISIGGYVTINSYIGKDENTVFEKKYNQWFSQKQKDFIKKYFFPYKANVFYENTIKKNKKTIKSQTQKLEALKYINLFEVELDFKKSLKDFKAPLISETKLSNNSTLKTFKLANGFYAGRANWFPGTGYIDFHFNNLVVVSARGVLGFEENVSDKLSNFKQIKNNINDFIDVEQFNKNQWFALKDLHIDKDKNKIFISYDEEMKPDCWNKSVIWGEMNYTEIQFKKLFSSKDCVSSIDNIDGTFRAFQSGGRIVNFDDNHILLSVGEYRSRHLAQEIDNINGKVIKININNSSYEIVSMGHRNPQGLFFDKENNYIFETEHGPKGGDEINLIEVDKFNSNGIQNYGWAMASAGVHYFGAEVPNRALINKKYPLYNSHSEHGFIEPLKSFVPAIGVSQITKINRNRYVASSLRAKSLFFFELDKEKKMTKLEKVEVFERVRDIIFKDNKLYLFLEDTASIGIISVN
tara:strand:+ start:1096 stop:2532 length:1437 start_codon:yes stop_codon:yes gene_type:complete